jgi:hypothetical protein
MNTYRVYLLDTTVVDKPAVSMAYFQATKYNDAWSGSRAVLAGKSEAEGRHLFEDASCTKALQLDSVENLTVAKILDCTPRNKKLDKATLADILADPKLSQKAKLEKIAALNQ